MWGFGFYPIRYVAVYLRNSLQNLTFARDNLRLASSIILGNIKFVIVAKIDRSDECPEAQR